MKLKTAEEYRGYLRDHSYPMAVDVPEDDVRFAEFILSPGFSRTRFLWEAKINGITVGEVVNAKYKEWCDAIKERKKQESDIGQHPGVSSFGETPETGYCDSYEQSGQVSV